MLTPRYSGQWKKPGDATRDKSTLDYWLWMAKLAEKGKISCIFLADAYGGMTARVSSNFEKSIADDLR